MSLTKSLVAAGVAACFALPALADGIVIEDAYARSSTGMSKSGAAFMVIKNDSGVDDRLIAAKSAVSKRVELHTHLSDGNGVMQMVEVEGGFPVAAGESHALLRGGDHVMFMGLNAPFTHGDMLSVTLVFEQAGEMQVEIPVDLERKPMHGKMTHGQGKMKHGQMAN